MELLKIGVVGSRGFNDYKLLKDTLDKYLNNVYLIVSGGAEGADSLGEKWANENNIKTLILKPDWKKHGKAAGFIRNTDIVDQSDMIIAFWDGLTRGTEDTIHKTQETDKKLEVIYFNKVF